MELEGTFTNGVAVPDTGMSVPPEGSRVKIVSHESLSGPTLGELLAPFIVDDCGLPEDYALNHEHYRYGAPKR